MGARKKEAFPCGNCGAPVPVGRLACSECGADAQTGWQSEEDIFLQSIEIPDVLGDELDAPPESPLGRGLRGKGPIAVAVVLLLVLILSGVYRLFF